MATVTSLQFVKVPGNSLHFEVTPFGEEGNCHGAEDKICNDQRSLQGAL